MAAQPGMSQLAPVAFDIETSGFEPEAVVTVVGLATDVGAWVGLNTGGRRVDEARLCDAVGGQRETALTVTARPDEAGLLMALREFAMSRLRGERHYLCAFNGETWRDGFDLPFLRTACARNDIEWPFRDLAYADVRSMVGRFNTGEVGDLAGVYDVLVGGESGDPFGDSSAAVTAYETGDWESLLAHNLADIRRTYALAVLAGRYVPKSDFRMKHLGPPQG